ncbi:MAG TPA: arsenic efflux protein, partial [Firmicutes bacterium]|nr:arsenic efflux protein [Bacillota bacterium]
HLLIGFFEARGKGRIKKNGVLSSPLAPLVGTGLALLPQCGFSVVASELYAKRLISVGTLVAVFIATSDEAIPILIGEAATDPALWGRMGLLIGVKVAMALVAGYALMCLLAVRTRSAKRARHAAVVESAEGHVCAENNGGKADGAGVKAARAYEDVHEESGISETSAHADCEDHDRDEVSEGDDGFLHAHGHGCCGHEIGEEKGSVFERYFKHPLVHTLTITLFAFAVNFILGTIIFVVKEENFVAFMQSGLYIQPLVATVVGLIPNCAASVMITELFANGSLGLGAAVAGLAVNAGLGIAVLVKENRRAGENALIIGGLIAFALAVGYALTPLG